MEGIMSAIKVTTKRQATLSAEFCRELGIKPGDEINVERRLMGGERVWILQPATPSLSWFGSLKKYTRHKSHDMEDIRKSIGRGLGREKSR